MYEFAGSGLFKHFGEFDSIPDSEFVGTGEPATYWVSDDSEAGDGTGLVSVFVGSSPVEETSTQ
jgi:hypothetical protein